MSRVPYPLLLCLSLLICGCPGSSSFEPDGRCAVRIDAVDPELLASVGGETLIITGRGFTDLSDMVVRIDGVEQSPEAMERSDCETCDACLFPEDGAQCGDCRAECEGSADAAPCIEQLTVVSPPLTGTTARVVVAGRYGVSKGYVVQVEEPSGDDSAGN